MNINKIGVGVKKFITLENILVSLSLIVAFVIRIFRVDQILNFNYDQGRDALVIWNLIHSHKFFLIGPTTGLPGIFRAPYYYYLITPFYYLGRGNPVWPEVFLAFTSVLAIALIYHLGKKIGGRTAGIIAAAISAFSLNILFASQWLSNPTPMLILSMVLVWAMIKVTEKKKWAWPIIAVVSGLSLFSFGSSGEFFYFLALFIFLIWTVLRQGFGGRSSLNIKIILISIFLFVLTFIPLVFFDLKHGHILLHNMFGTFGMGSGSFAVPSWGFIKSRTISYFDIFTNKIFPFRNITNQIILSIVGISFLIFLPKLIKNIKFNVVLLLLLSATIGLYFYQGNYGVLYDYYMTGYYMIFILFFAIILGQIWKVKILGKVFIVIFFYLFFANNIPTILGTINNSCDTPTSICFVDQKEAIDWIYKDANGRDFNVDEYVPPVITYSYNYLFTWLGTTKYHKLPVEPQISLLYTLYEVDPPHPERLQAWLTRQQGIGKVIKQETIGGITVQERERIPGGK
jgi:4-amino-4-deoxy-L-arabinose transferase-like glycosyltransferase